MRGVSESALVISAKVARACDGAAAKAFPPRQPRNPAADRAKRSAQDQRIHLDRSVANGGKIDDLSQRIN